MKKVIILNFKQNRNLTARLLRKYIRSSFPLINQPKLATTKFLFLVLSSLLALAIFASFSRVSQ